MNQQDFQQEINGLLMLVGSFKTNELFKAVAQEMIHEVGLEQAMGGDPVVVMEKVGSLKGALKTQERWLFGEAERLIASGQARWVHHNEVQQ